MSDVPNRVSLGRSALTALIVLAASQSLPAIAGAVSPVSPTAPIVVQFPENMQAGRAGTPASLAYALIGEWANAAQNRESAQQVEAFRAQTEGLDFAGIAGESLRCLGVPEPRTACRESLTLPAAEDEDVLAAQLAASGVTEFVMVEVVPLLSAERFRVRAFVNEMTVTPKGLRSTRRYGAIYDTRAPQSLIDAGPERVAEFWSEGQPSRIRRETRAAAEEVERALSYFGEKLGDGPRPKFAKDLPGIKELEASGRAACRGMPCAQVRVIRDDGARMWLTATNPFGALGPAIASLDESSAKFSVNLFGLVLLL